MINLVGRVHHRDNAPYQSIYYLIMYNLTSPNPMQDMAWKGLCLTKYKVTPTKSIYIDIRQSY